MPDVIAVVRYSVALIGTAGLLVACAPKARPDFASPDATSRVGAIELAVQREDRSKVPELVSLLESDDPLIRMLAIRSLERLTGQTLGYEHSGPEWDRRQRIEAWVQWSNEQGYSRAAQPHGQSPTGQSTTRRAEAGGDDD